MGEAFPNVLAESMICGVPCIATDVGDSKYIIGKNGWIVKPSSPNDLANSLFDAISILKNNKKRKIIKEECKLKVENE